MNRRQHLLAISFLAVASTMLLAPDIQAADVTYKGWSGKCIGCPIVQASYDGLALIARQTYTGVVEIILRPLYIMVALYLLWVLGLYTGFFTSSEADKYVPKDQVQSFILKHLAVSLFFLTSGIFGFELVYNAIYGFVIAQGAQIAYAAMDAAAKATGAGGLFPASIFTIAAPTCNTAINAGGYMACMVHLTEASLGFIPEMFWQDLTAFRITTLTFWIALLMFRQTLEPFMQVTKDIIVGFLGGTFALVIAPVGLALWIIPATSRFGVAWVGQFVHSALLLTFVAVATVAVVAMTYAGLAVALKQPETMSIGDGISAAITTTPWNLSDRIQQAMATATVCQAGNDHFSCVISLARSGKLNLNPDSPLLWIVLLMLRAAGSVFSEASENARYYRDKIIGG